LGYNFVDRLIICSHKGLLKGDILIDDNDSGRGQEHFEGRLIHFGSPQCPDWASVRSTLNIKT
jgi:5'(3')-deoxyribonucleotidase